MTTGDPGAFLDHVITAILAIMVVSLFVALIRLVRGPSVLDRVVALDLMSIYSVGMIAAYAVDTEQVGLLDVAIAVALITFLATVAIARYLEKGVRKRSETDGA